MSGNPDNDEAVLSDDAIGDRISYPLLVNCIGLCVEEFLMQQEEETARKRKIQVLRSKKRDIELRQGNLSTRKQKDKKSNFPLPTKCEYCGVSSLKDCNATTCKRPKSFFIKQRPPFVPRGHPRWDHRTDTENQKIEYATIQNELEQTSPSSNNDNPINNFWPVLWWT